MRSYREHLRRTVARLVRSRLLALFAPNSGEGFPKIGVNALGITKGVIEDRFHLCLGPWLMYGHPMQDVFPARQVTLVQAVGNS